MFFDEPRTDSIKEQLLKEIAVKQKQLFSCRFNWENTTIIAQKKKGNVAPCYNKMFIELDELKLRMKQYCKEQGYYQGNVWWNLPWEQVEESLYWKLQEVEEAGKWRYAHQWSAVQEKDMYVLFLRGRTLFRFFFKKFIMERRGVSV